MTTITRNMSICLRKKTIRISRGAIRNLGNPSHLRLRYDEVDRVLFIYPGDPTDLDDFEIPHSYWSGTNQQCEISRFALLKALQHRLSWENGSKYVFGGMVTVLNEMPTLVFMLAEGTRIR